MYRGRRLREARCPVAVKFVSQPQHKVTVYLRELRAIAAKNKQITGAKAAKRTTSTLSCSILSRELKHYRKHLGGKVVYCNCDDPG